MRVHGPRAVLFAVVSLCIAGCSRAPSHARATSTLDGVRLEIVDGKREISLAQAKAGVSFPYRLVVDVDEVTVTPRLGPCAGPMPTGLAVREEIAGNGRRYALDDRGLCATPPARPVTLRRGSYPAQLSWDGRSWRGPSDTNNPEGPPFPPGTYTFKVSAEGTSGDGKPFALTAELPFVLVE